MTATASNAPASTIDPSAVFLNGRLISGVIYHADGSKEKRYLRAPLLSGYPSVLSKKRKAGLPAATGGMEVKGLH